MKNTKQKELLIVAAIDNKGVIRSENIANVQAVNPKEFVQASNLKMQFCFGLLAGVYPEGLADSKMPAMWCEKNLGIIEKRDQQAIRDIMKITPAELRDAWAAYVGKLKKLKGVTLQALGKAAKGLNATPAKSDEKPLRQFVFECWVQIEQGVITPADAFDSIAATYGFEMPEDESAPEAEPEPEVKPEPKAKAKRVTKAK